MRSLPFGVLVSPWAVAACDGGGPAGEGGLAVSDYLASDVAVAWTWRDDGDTGIAESDAEVLRGRMDEDGRVDVRRGAHWPDGDPVGQLTWKLGSSDIVLESWGWTDAAGSDDATILAVSGGRDGDVTESGGGSCTMTRVEPLSTTYGTFEAALQSECEGAPASDGTYWFAAGFGLVRAQTGAFRLDLVAPY